MNEELKHKKIMASKPIPNLLTITPYNLSFTFVPAIKRKWLEKRQRPEDERSKSKPIQMKKLISEEMEKKVNRLRRIYGL